MPLSVHCPGRRDMLVEVTHSEHQVFDNTPAAKEATLEAGDELVGINGANVKVLTIFRNEIEKSLSY